MLCVMVNHVLLGDIFQEHTRFTYALDKYILQVVWKNFFVSSCDGSLTFHLPINVKLKSEIKKNSHMVLTHSTAYWVY